MIFVVVDEIIDTVINIFHSEKSHHLRVVAVLCLVVEDVEEALGPIVGRAGAREQITRVHHRSHVLRVTQR